MTEENILVIKHGALGDIVIATAGFAAIRAQHPHAHITCLTTKHYAELLALSPYFNEIWVDSKPKLFERAARKRLKAMLRSKPWAWVYDLQTSKRSTLYQWLLARPWPHISNVSRFASHGYTDPARHGKHALTNLKIQMGIAGVKNVGLPDVSWLKAEVTGVESRESSENDKVNSGVPLPLRERPGEGTLKLHASLSSPLTQPSPARGEGFTPGRTPYALLVPGRAAHRPEKRWPAE